jgi:hypothetical protein
MGNREWKGRKDEGEETETFSFLSHPWAELFKHEVSGALAPPLDAPAGMHCLVIPGVELKRLAALSSSSACGSSSLLQLHRPQRVHSNEPLLAGGRRHPALVVLRRMGPPWLALEVEMEACWSLWSC